MSFESGSVVEKTLTHVRRKPLADGGSGNLQAGDRLFEELSNALILNCGTGTRWAIPWIVKHAKPTRPGVPQLCLRSQPTPFGQVPSRQALIRRSHTPDVPRTSPGRLVDMVDDAAECGHEAVSYLPTSRPPSPAGNTSFPLRFTSRQNAFLPPSSRRTAGRIDRHWHVDTAR